MSESEGEKPEPPYIADPVLRSRVEALRKLASEEVVPAVREVTQKCAEGEEVPVHRESMGLNRLIGRKEEVQMRFQVPEDSTLQVSEAAVVFGAIAASLPSTLWRGRYVVELGCGVGYIGLVLAALGAKVTLTDLPHNEGLVTGSIALNSLIIRSPASVSFCPLDWQAPRTFAPACNFLSSASLVVAVDPVVDLESEKAFIATCHALLGMDGQPPICRTLEGLMVVHKHRHNYCIGGYCAPSVDARPAITHAEECSRCSFRQSLEDAGLFVNTFEIKAPEEFAHPFVECWELNTRRQY